jgi:hypothetical protein
VLKCKLAKLRSQLIEAATDTKGPKGEGFDVMKSGDARVSFSSQNPPPTNECVLILPCVRSMTRWL